ncbi:unnamed protein product [Closterium sp. Naga37s-1]|nr:unnamed protein product [Closterium sp. Naga37s-1]
MAERVFSNVVRNPIFRPSRVRLRHQQLLVRRAHHGCLRTLYRGEECLNDVQINALLAFDARRYLIRAKERIEKFNSFCCNVQSIFADIAFTHAKTRLGAQFSPAIERAQSSQYKEAAEDLRRSKWCRKHEQVCRADTRAMEEGCPTAAVSGSRKVGESWLPADSLTCVPATTTVMERSEGRSRCAYDSRLGYRAIGVGYNLDDKSDERMREIATILADYDKLYSGEACLNDLQINTLLALDARRFLLRAGESVKALDNFCCNVQAVFADIAFTHSKSRLGAQFDPTIQKASSFQWREAAEELRQSKWCRKNKDACTVDTQQLEEGCSSVGDNAVYVSLGCPVLDHFLRGGLRACQVTELVGEAASGKTQLCLQLALAVQAPVSTPSQAPAQPLLASSGSPNASRGAALYIYTDGRFPTKRLFQLANSSRFQNLLESNSPGAVNSNGVQTCDTIRSTGDYKPAININQGSDRGHPCDHVFIKEIPTVQELTQCLEGELHVELVRARAHPIRLLIIDSIASLFRSEFDNSRDDMCQRTTMLFRIASALKHLADR